MTESKVISKRYDFVLLFDVSDGNPNGDPDDDNFPRIDPETLQGLVTDVCLKRKVRNYVLYTKHQDSPQESSKKTPYDGDPYDIFIREGKVLNQLITEASREISSAEESKQGMLLLDDVTPTADDKKNNNNKVDISGLWQRYYDVRTFGAVVSTGSLKGKSDGQIRGPVQLTFARSIDPIITLEHSITRCAVTDEKDVDKERTMGRKHTVSYGLYKAYGFVSPCFADRTKFNEEDLSILWEALLNMFDLDHSASRGLMTTRKLIVFEHESKYGNTQASKLFEMLKIVKKDDTKPARSFEDYEVTLNGKSLDESDFGLPEGVRILKELM